METKKVPLNIYVRPEVKAAVEKHSTKEDRTPSNLSDRLLGWAVKHLAKARNSDELMSWQAGEGGGLVRPPPVGRVSVETQEQLFTALEAVLQNAPSPVIEAVADYLSDKAGKFGGGDDERSATATSTPRKSKRA